MGITVLLGVGGAGCTRPQAGPDVATTSDAREDAHEASLDVIEALDAVDEPEVIEVRDEGPEVAESDAEPMSCPEFYSVIPSLDPCRCLDGAPTVAPCICCIASNDSVARVCPGRPTETMRNCA